MDYAITALVVGIVMALIKVIEKLIDHNGEKKSILMTDEREWLRELYTQHQKFDENGTPIWYVPRSWDDTQQEIVKALTTVVGDQRRIAELLDKIEQRYEKISETLSEMKNRC